MLKDFWAAKDEATAKDIARKVQTRSVDQVFSIYSPAPQAPILWDPPLQNFEGQRPFNHQFFYKDAFHWLA